MLGDNVICWVGPGGEGGEGGHPPMVVPKQVWDVAIVELPDKAFTAWSIV